MSGSHDSPLKRYNATIPIRYAMNIPSYQALETRIDACMIADRYHLRRDLKKKKERGRVAKAIERSTQLVAARQSSRPAVNYPGALPVSANVEKILQTIASNQVVIIAGETGSGKTTQLPKICLDAGLGISVFSAKKTPTTAMIRAYSAAEAPDSSAMKFLMKVFMFIPL